MNEYQELPFTEIEIKPNACLHIVNLNIPLCGKVPNRFQRFMLKLVFGIEIEVLKDVD